MKQNRLLPILALLAVTAIWGSTFFMTKEIMNELTPFDFLGLRLTIAAVAIAFLMPKRLVSATRKDWIRGGLLAAVNGTGSVFQTVGLKYTDASVSGFITGMYVVLTPILVAILFRQQIRLRVWVAVTIATVGLAFLSLQGLSFGFGETLTLISAVFFAFHVTFLSRWAAETDPLSLAVTQLVAGGAYGLVIAVPGGITPPQTTGAWMSLLYMAIVGAVVTLLLQTWAQSKLPATNAAVIMATEPVFAAAFAVALGGEQLTVRLVIGGALVLSAMLLVETGSSDADTEDGNADEGDWERNELGSNAPEFRVRGARDRALDNEEGTQPVDWVPSPSD